MFKRLLATVVVGVAGLTACERPGAETTGSTGDTTATTAVVATTTLPTTDTTSPTTEPTVATTAPRSTSPSTTEPGTDDTTPPSTTASTAPPTTRPEPTSPADLVLSFDGVEPFLFGQPDDEVVKELVALLGDPVDDVASDYPSSNDDGMFLTEEESLSFIFPFGRTVCFTNGLCTAFGAGADSALLFTGWEFGGTDAAGMSTEDGITVGSSWADHADVIEVDEVGCSQEGYGRASGVDLLLVSDGDPFAAAQGSGNPAPDASSVRVTAMSAGELPESVDGDC